MTNLGTNETLVVSNTAVGFANIPAGAQHAHIAVEDQPLRMKDDDTAPTASVGTPYAAGEKEYYTGDLGKVKFIRTGSTDSKVQVRYYG